MKFDIQNLMKYKINYLIFSVVILIPGIISLALFGLRLSIDFTGGSLLKYQFETVVEKDVISQTLHEHGVEVETISFSGNTATIRTKPIEAEKNDEIKYSLEEKFEGSKQLSFETVGPSIGGETATNAVKALGWALVGILLFIAFAFRKIPKPYSSFRFGVSAIIAMFHDALFVLGAFSLLSHFYSIEIDALFITAVLTVIGFSVHDSIVVFDRIRENLQKLPSSWNFEKVTNYSIVETLNRSLATSLTVVITLSSLYILGGESIKEFVLAMLIGVISGSYSSIFTASPILVLWEDFVLKRKKK
jgi:preprotein translocase subunit SecF